MTAISTKPVTKYAAEALEPSAEHAQHLVSLLEKVPADRTPESVAYAEFVVSEFAKRYEQLEGLS